MSENDLYHLTNLFIYTSLLLFYLFLELPQLCSVRSSTVCFKHLNVPVQDLAHVIFP